MKIDFEYFQIQKWILQTDRKKVDEKNGVICLVFMFPSWVTVLKLSKKVHFFFQFCADISKKSRSIKVIYIYTSGRSRCALSEKGTVYYAMDSVLEILVFVIEKFC